MYWKILDSKFKFELQLEAEKPMELKTYTGILALTSDFKSEKMQLSVEV